MVDLLKNQRPNISCYCPFKGRPIAQQNLRFTIVSMDKPFKKQLYRINMEGGGRSSAACHGITGLIFRALAACLPILAMSQAQRFLNILFQNSFPHGELGQISTFSFSCEQGRINTLPYLDGELKDIQTHRDQQHETFDR